MSDSQRIETLENIVRALASEVRALRAELDRLGSTRVAASPAAPVAAPVAAPASTVLEPPAPRVAPGPVPPRPRAAEQPSPPRVAPRTAPDDLDVETLVGRYGAVAVAALTILMGVGAFVRWAIEHVRLGPEVRVLLGALGAVAVALAGAWLRRRGHARFGSILLALALAITHVVAWGAGPQLGVLPPQIALAVAALASAALALLAWRADEELLFVVGVGGAFVAPFVTSSGPGSIAVLLAFGWLVFSGGAAGVRGRRWPVANVVLALAVSAYAATAFAGGNRGTLALALAPLSFSLACAWSAILLDRDGALRGAVRGALLTAAVLAVPLADVEPAAALRLAAVAGTITAYARRLRVGHEDAGVVVEGAIVPLLFLSAALATFGDPSTPLGAAHAVVWAMMAAGAAWHAGPVRRDVHAFVAAVAGGVAVVLALSGRGHLLAPALAAYGVALVAVTRSLRAPIVVLPAAASLLLGAFGAAELLVERPDFAYAPFLTLPSLVAAAVLALWILAGVAARDEERDASTADGLALLMAPRLWWTASAVLALLWGREELAYAISPDVANFLVIAYFAVAGVSAIAFGRMRAIAGARQAGLALAVYADLKAIFQAAQISSVGLRVGSYLLSGFFLLAVGYWAWTARRGEEAESPAGGGPDAAPSHAP